LLTNAIRDAGLTYGEYFWPMPLWDFYNEQLKSEFADIVNSGPREGGATYAALFLKRFIKAETAWAHLDIAGPAFKTNRNHFGPIGATGFGVRTLFAIASSWEKK
jgi:leucyl aminopeptidase